MTGSYSNRRASTGFILAARIAGHIPKVRPTAIDVEKAIQIGLLPDLPWGRFSYLGNTSVQGAYLALTCREHRAQVDEIAAKMTYLELSADNRFMDAFTSALFLPHTDERLFPSVRRARLAAKAPAKVAVGSQRERVRAS